MGNCAGKSKNRKKKRRNEKATENGQKDKERPLIYEVDDNISHDGIVTPEGSDSEVITNQAPLAVIDDIELDNVNNVRKENGAAVTNDGKDSEQASASANKVRTQRGQGSRQKNITPSKKDKTEATEKDDSKNSMKVVTLQSSPQSSIIKKNGEDAYEAKKDVTANTSVRVQTHDPNNFASWSKETAEHNFAKGNRMYPPKTTSTSGNKEANQGGRQKILTESQDQQGTLNTRKAEISLEFDGGSLKSRDVSTGNPQNTVISQPESSGPGHNTGSQNRGQGNSQNIQSESDNIDSTAGDQRQRDVQKPDEQRTNTGQGHTPRGQEDTKSNEQRFVDANHDQYNEQELLRQQQNRRKLSRQERVNSEDEDDSSSDDSFSSSSTSSSDGGQDTVRRIDRVQNMIIGNNGKIFDRRNQSGWNIKDSRTKKKRKERKRKDNVKGGTQPTSSIKSAENVIIGNNGKVIDERDQSNWKIIKGTKQTKGGKKKEKDDIPPSSASIPIPTEHATAIAKISNAVGIICGHGINGTAFRIGDDKVQTAWHVVHKMILNNNTNKWELARFKDVIVDFDYTNNYTVDRFRRYKVEANIVYENRNLDIIILKLMENENGTPFPPPLTDFEHFNADQHGQCSIYLVGHSHGSIKQIDRILKYWDPTPNRIRSLEKWSSDNYGENYDDQNHMTLKERLMFECSFRQGASGAPGFYVPSRGKAVVLTMLLRGYPDFIYRDSYEDERQNVDIQYLKQQGIHMGTMMEDIRSYNKALFKEIFERNQSYNILPSGSSVPSRMSSQTDGLSEGNLSVTNSSTNREVLDELIRPGTSENVGAEGVNSQDSATESCLTSPDVTASALNGENNGNSTELNSEDLTIVNDYM